MTQAFSAPRRKTRPALLLLLGLAGLIALAIAGLFAPAVVLRGWLIGFANVGGLGLGCVAWLTIHGLTAGRWGEAGRPALLAGAAALPLAILLAVPLILADRWLYPWASDPGTTGPGVATIYLNGWSVSLRGIVLLGTGCWAALRTRRGPLGTMPAALMLLVYGGLMNLAAFDWLLSLEPRYTSSAFGMQIITLQLAAALCWVILVTRAPGTDPVWGDYGGLLLATVLGESYLILMTLVIHWYGDLPEQARWFVSRTDHGWIVLEIAGVAVGSIGPMLALLFAPVRHNPAALRFVALAVLAGVTAEYVWLVAPAIGPGGAWAALAGVLATVCAGALLLGLTTRLEGRSS